MMIEETRQQPDALARTLEEADGLSRFLAGRHPRFVILAARGTSDNAAQFGRPTSSMIRSIVARFSRIHQ